MSAGAQIRLATEADAAALLAIYAPYVRETAITFETESPSEAEFRGRIRTVLAYAPWLVCEQNGTALGYAYASRFHARPAYQWTVEVTVYVDRTRHRTRIGRALYTALLAAVRALGYRVAVGVIALPNPASVGLHEALGFVRAGVLPRVGYKLGAWRDVGWWVLELHAGADAPVALRAMDDVCGSPTWTAALAAGARVLGQRGG